MARFPGDLESQYSRLFSRFIDTLNREYIKILRQVLAELDEPSVINSAVSVRYNAPQYQKFLRKLKAIRKNLPRKKIFKNIFKSMAGIFQRTDETVVKEITKQFRKKKFPIPELAMKADPLSLTNAIRDNVDLISAIADKQSENLEVAVLSAVTGGSNFDAVIEEVEKQSDRGRSYAEFVARDQVAKTYAAVNEERQKQAGFPGYIWQATNDSRTRATHRAMNNTFHRWDDPPLVGDRNLHPGEDYQCRCIAVPSFDAVEDLPELEFVEVPA